MHILIVNSFGADTKIDKSQISFLLAHIEKIINRPRGVDLFYDHSTDNYAIAIYSALILGSEKYKDNIFRILETLAKAFGIDISKEEVIDKTNPETSGFPLFELPKLPIS